MRFFICIVVSTLIVGMVADAFILTNIGNSVSNYKAVLAPVTQLQSKTDDNNNVQVGDNEEQQVNHRHNYFDRRNFIYATSLLLSGAAIQPVLAASSSSSLSPSKQEEIDKINIVKGYDRLQYLLSNWEQETTICGMGGDKLERSCDRTPMKVMEYMGYKSTTDPLYKAEKTLRRLYENTNVPAKRDAEFLEAVEVFSENADEASGMAFISSWGESNPGGGRDRVELFIERSRKNIVAARNSLATVIDILDLKS